MLPRQPARTRFAMYGRNSSRCRAFWLLAIPSKQRRPAPATSAIPRDPTSWRSMMPRATRSRIAANTLPYGRNRAMAHGESWRIFSTRTSPKRHLLNSACALSTVAEGTRAKRLCRESESAFSVRIQLDEGQATKNRPRSTPGLNGAGRAAGSSPRPYFRALVRVSPQGLSSSRTTGPWEGAGRATMRTGISVNLHGDGHFTSIGARFETRKCPVLPGETAAKLLHAQDDEDGRKGCSVRPESRCNAECATCRRRVAAGRPSVSCPRGQANGAASANITAKRRKHQTATRFGPVPRIDSPQCLVSRPGAASFQGEEARSGVSTTGARYFAARSSTSRTLRPSTAGVNGFWRKATP